MDLWRIGKNGTQHLVTRTEGLHSSATKREHMVDRRERARAMRNHHEDAAACTHAEHGLLECGLAFGVEV
jgi:hypothetical protein